MRKLALPALVVARPLLGTINHTLLTVKTLIADGQPVRGVVLSCGPRSTYEPHAESLAVTSLESVLHQWLPVPLLGRIPPLDLVEGCFQSGSPALASFQELHLF
jgi:dethiobiotin synthetase